MAFDVGNRLWDGRRPQDGHMMEMSYRCCCAAAGMVFLPHSTRLHPSCVPACSPASSSTKFDMLPLTASALSATVMTGRQCCRHVGTVTAACTAQVSDLRTTLWTSVFGCGVLLRSLPNQTPCSTCPGPVGLPALQGPARLQPTAPRQCHVLSNTARRTALRLATASCCRHAQAIPHSPGHTPALLSAELSPSWYAIPARNR